MAGSLKCGIRENGILRPLKRRENQIVTSLDLTESPVLHPKIIMYSHCQRTTGTHILLDI